ncbi:MAG: hypothetical protein ACP5T3_01285 [Candidatus Micrarchaeia archaeon]
MKTKPTILELAAFAVIAALLPLASAQVSGALSIANLAVEPNPAVAGQNLTITFQLYNSYDNTLKNIDMQLQGAYPLLNYSPAGTYEISTLGDGLSPGYYSYTLHIPSTAPEGTYTLDIVATYETAPATGFGEEVGSSVMPITLYLYNKPDILINVLPSQITPGGLFSAELLVMNAGYGTARAISVKLLNSTGFSVSGSSTLSVGTLQQGAEQEEQASYYVSRNASAGEHELRFLVNYTTSTNKTYSEIANASVDVLVTQPSIKVSAQGAMPETLYNGYNQTLSLLVQNVGSGTAKNVSISILPGNGTQVLSSASTFFIGSLMPGASTQVSVLVSANSNASNASLIAKATYYSANYANKYSELQALNLTLAPSAQFEVVSEKSELVPGATDVPLTFTLRNTGNEYATNVQFSLQSVYPITPIASTYYLASLAPGSEANVTFLASADTQAVPGNYPVTIYEQWKQPNGAANQEYTGATSYFAEVSAYSGSSGAYAGIGILVVIAIIAAYAANKRRTRKKGKQAR